MAHRAAHPPHHSRLAKILLTLVVGQAIALISILLVQLFGIEGWKTGMEVISVVLLSTTLLWALLNQKHP